jgi:hypothetical protein
MTLQIEHAIGASMKPFFQAHSPAAAQKNIAILIRLVITVI